MSDTPKGGCPVYTVQIKTYDATAPTVYKCMDDKEYQAYTAQVYQQDHGSDGSILLMFGGIFLFALMVALILAFATWRRKQRRLG